MILDAAVTRFLESRTDGEPAASRSWLRVERLARDLATAWHEPTHPPESRAWPFLTALEPAPRGTTSLAVLELLTADRADRLQLFQAAALACVRNAAHDTPGHWRPEPTTGPYFRVASVLDRPSQAQREETRTL